jgi:hypothetical protein
VGALGYQARVSIWIIYFVVYLPILGIGVILFRTSSAVQGVDESKRDDWTLMFIAALAIVLALPLNFWW